MASGNFKDAYESFASLALDPQADGSAVGDNMARAIECLSRLNRVDEADAFREKVIALHADNWHLLHAAALSYFQGEHAGYIIAGEFSRGGHRGGGRWVNSQQRDRVHALQLMQQAMAGVKSQNDAVAVGEFYWDLAGMLMGGRNCDEAWRLQSLTDLAVLPDYDEGYSYGHESRGAPVDENAQPIYYATPKTWQDSANDGQRWRWALAQAMEASPSRKGPALLQFASFLESQFGVQTMREYGWFASGDQGDETRKNESGPYDVHTLADDETIAKLASGIKRFKLPDEFNYIRVLREVAAGADESAAEAVDRLARIFENRRQYPKAAGLWRDAIKRFTQGVHDYRQKALDQIVGDWGEFEPVLTQPAGQGATVEFRFRNAAKVEFTAQEVDVATLLGDVKEYLKSNPGQLDHAKLRVSELGYRLLIDGQQKYLKAQVAQWSLDLTPRPEHWDRRITVATPLQKAGAYLLTAKLPGGNTSRIVVWVADTAIVSKPMAKRPYYYVADAVTGQPVPKATLEFFGYRSEWTGGNAGWYRVLTTGSTESTDADGQCIPKSGDWPEGYEWIVTATTPQGRLAYLGFTRVWTRGAGDPSYNEDKVYVMTDRPVYRPGGPVKFKFWANHARYDQEGKSAFAGKRFLVQVNNPKGEKVYEHVFTADDYGGFDGELTLEKDAALGQYSIFLPPNDQPQKARLVPGHVAESNVLNPCTGGGTFTVEEYKKPEFEVTVEAPKQPVMLGEKIEAKILAKYYFGAPVTEAKVTYKVMRSSYRADWYPARCWDWFYGAGYWWFAADYGWYPGWNEWGCRRPVHMWYSGWGRPEQPEVVAEAEVPIGKDGAVKVEIDTALAKAIHADTDHKYEITAEVVDQSRRTIVGSGQVLVARKPFKVYAWVDRGHYRAGDVIHASFNAQTLDNKPIAKAKGELRLLSVRYEQDSQTGQLKPLESEVQKWALSTGEDGHARQEMKADKAGQYRLAYTVTDSAGHAIEGGYLLTIVGEGFDGGDFRFNDIELVTDSPEYAPSDKVGLMINTNRADSAVLLFVRPGNGAYLPPEVLRLKGKSIAQEIKVLKKDMPNFFIEAVTVHDGKVFSETREVVVPPESRVLNVAVTPLRDNGREAAKDQEKDASASTLPRYKPGEKAKFKIKLTDAKGEPFTGSAVVSVYDKAVEYISGGSNVPEIKAFFWKWRRYHTSAGENSLARSERNWPAPGQVEMQFLGVFGATSAEDADVSANRLARLERSAPGGAGMPPMSCAPCAVSDSAGLPTSLPPALNKKLEPLNSMHPDLFEYDSSAGEGQGGAMVEPTVRTNFADTALWVGRLEAKDGLAEVELTMPENLSTWKARVWAMGGGAKCGEGDAEVVTSKNLLVRLQAPRFFLQKDEVVLSANVHNYLKTAKHVKVALELDNRSGVLWPMALPGVAGDGRTVPPQVQTVDVEAGGEKRVDWRVKVIQPGQAVVRMKALTDEESDAVEMKFPVLIHGMLKTDSFCGVIRPEKDSLTFDIKVPAERLPAQSRLEIRYSPTLAGAMVDALPYLVDYPYGCTEQTINRFLPTVVTQKVLLSMGVDLKQIRDKQTNLNAQQIGDDKARARDPSYQGGYMSRATAGVKNPVFDPDEVSAMVRAGLERLLAMQCSDGGWGWFSGYGEQSWPHTTALVVHGLQVARANDVALTPGMLDRGIEWLKRYQAEELRRLNLPKKESQHKDKADAIDAFVYMVLVDESKDKLDNAPMRELLYRDRVDLPVYAQAMLGLALHKVGDRNKLTMVLTNIRQFLVQDEENQTAYLKLPENNWWWCWYGSEYEAQSYYLKLLSATDTESQVASRLVKYLINNRRNGSYWNSTRDTATCVEAMAEYIKSSGEDKPDMTVAVSIDGKVVKEIKIDKGNLFSFDNKLILEGEAVTAGPHKIELKRTGSGPLYCNAYLTNFTLEDPIKSAGLEIKLARKYYKLLPVDKTAQAQGSHGQAVDQKVSKLQRQELQDLSTLKSGDQVEIELEIESKNDYEYILFEDMKASGFEPVDLRSGYSDNDMGAYMELRDERVTFFVRALARGKHSLRYRMRAETPGKFAAMPAKASAMYAPELKANSDEFKVGVED